VIVVGSGPNGLAAAITLARAGLGVQVLEGAETPGGGCRTAELTLPGFRHDVCSAVYPLAAASPFFRSINLAAGGVKLLTPKVAFVHPLDGGGAAVVAGSVAETARGLGADSAAYQRLLEPLVRDMERITATFLGPLRSVPAHPVSVVQFGLEGLQSAARLVRRFRTEEAKVILAGTSAHACRPMGAPLTSAYGLLFTTMAHAVGWPVVEGGGARLVEALVAELEAHGGQVITGTWVSRLADLPAARLTLLDVTPRQFIGLAGDRLPPRYVRALRRFQYGPGICKVDWALDGPVPWAAQAARQAGTLHLGGTFAEIARSESDVAAGRHPQHPFCLVVQPGVVDTSRAPQGKHTLWGYCHVPPGSTVDMTERIEAQIERFAPGFRDLVVARSTRTAAKVERHNPNHVGGDITGGAVTLRQTLFRPVMRWNQYRTALPGVYLCSSSTPPGGGVHGMCGAFAAKIALADLRHNR